MKLINVSLGLLLPLSLLLSACSQSDTAIALSDSVDTVYPYEEGDVIPASAYLEHNEVYNPEAVIPPQCYTRTEGKHNPCYACHQTYDLTEKRPNQMNDGTLQGNYEFSDVGLTNSWKNLFLDRRELIKNINDSTILEYISEDNYEPAISDNAGLPEEMHLAKLAHPQQAFAKNGIANDGSGWVAYNYKPFPSTFWPTNGSTGDAMIRLPAAFRQVNGQYQQDTYLANLTLVEMAIKDVAQLPVANLNELRIGTDIDGNGELTTNVNRMKRLAHFVGDAKDITIEHLLYPEGTEFLHTVRYIGVTEEGDIYNAPRMKEVRYMKKALFRSRESLSSAYYAEAKDKYFEKLPQTRYLGETGIENGFGWLLNAYIEDENGELRPQHEQELAYCNGCHKTVGSTFDQTFSFARKVSGAKGWGYINLHAIDDVPNRGEQVGEFLTYMERVGGGDEFRQNAEMLARWFTQDGKLDKDKVQKVPSIYELITPSRDRALALNKAYKTIVTEQSFLFGRDATITEAKNVLQEIDTEQAPLLPAHRYQWDMRLDWEADMSTSVAAK